MNLKDPNLPLWQLTIGEFMEILNKKINSAHPITEAPKMEKEYVYGISGLAGLLGCSKTHAGKLKRDGVFDGAIIQNGRKIIIDKAKALELFNNREL